MCRGRSASHAASSSDGVIASPVVGDASGDPFGWLFEDNYFDLLPGETKVVRILGGHSAGRVTAKPWYSPHQTAVEWQANR